MSNNNLNYEELRNALNLIQNICIKHNCNVCPFGYDSGICLITDTAPRNWRFADPIPIIRLLK